MEVILLSKYLAKALTIFTGHATHLPIYLKGIVEAVFLFDEAAAAAVAALAAVAGGDEGEHGCPDEGEAHGGGGSEKHAGRRSRRSLRCRSRSSAVRWVVG